MAQPDGIPKQKNIIRIDTKKIPGRKGGGTHGWQVKFEFNLLKISKFFSDLKYGGVLPALDEAISFRDSYETDTYASRSKMPESTDVQKDSKKSKKKGIGVLPDQLSGQEKQTTENKFSKKPPFSQTNPELLLEWDYEKNVGIDPDSPPNGRSTRVGWKCLKNPAHKWDSLISNRTRGKGCPYCAGQLTIPSESVAALRPELMSEWHPTKNEGIDPFKLGLGSQTRIWWLCSEGHEWSTLLFTRTRDDKGCQKCRGTVAGEKNSLATLFPEIAAEWHPTRNDRTPSDVTSKSHYAAVWKCPVCLNEWKTSVHMRTILKSGCNICAFDRGALTTKTKIIEKQEELLPNYDYETDDEFIANAQALRQLITSQIKTETDLKPIESLLNPRLLSRINYQPYYQRNYVWDNDKATYFIESVIIGTEVPPLIFYETSDGFEVIDGRQRFQTLLRFQTNQFSLSPKGLAVRKDLVSKKFDELPAPDKNLFFDAKLRLIRFSVVNTNLVDDQTQDMLKKEIFRRYNSGITPLRQVDIEKAVYITDEPTQFIKDKFKKNKYLYKPFVALFLGLDAEAIDQDHNILEKALQETRFLLVCANMPILSTRKKETLQQFYEWFSETLQDVHGLYRDFVKRVKLTGELSDYFENNGLKPTRLWNEIIYWALAVIEREGRNFNELLSDTNKVSLLNLYKTNEKAYAQAESQFFYSQFLTRYNTMASFLEEAFDLSLGPYLRKRMRAEDSKVEPELDEDENSHFSRIEKQDPTSLSVEDLCRDISRSRYLLRPSYQRNEVINRTKSSGIIESILLGIKLPPLYAYRRADGICEIIDGQQRILSILGFLGRPFLNERDEQIYSEKNNFSLSKLRILDDFNGKTFQDLPSTLQNRIWDYNLSVITIDEKFNNGFNPVDLFIRLNSRPYPIKENTFEMWNSYVDKDIVDSIKQVTNRHCAWFYMTRDNTRMRNEELISILTYLAHTQTPKSSAQAPIEAIVDVYLRGSGIGVRVKNKAAVSRMMDMGTISENVREEVKEATKRIDSFIKKVRTILIDSDAEDDNVFLDGKLSGLFNTSEKRWYVRRYHDFYALWYLLHDLPLEVAIRRRDELREDLNLLLRSMKKRELEEDAQIEPFISNTSIFKDKYAVAERKIRLTRKQRNDLIKKQGNICPLCNAPIFIIDDVEVDHIVPIAVQGQDENTNLQVVHTRCNRKKGVRLQTELDILQ